MKLFDFGFAVAVDEKDPKSLYEKCGTLRYMAPEVGECLEKSRYHFSLQYSMIKLLLNHFVHFALTRPRTGIRA